jgi:hypothetical protein
MHCFSGFMCQLQERCIAEQQPARCIEGGYALLYMGQNAQDKGLPIYKIIEVGI